MARHGLSVFSGYMVPHVADTDGRKLAHPAHHFVPTASIVERIEPRRRAAFPRAAFHNSE